MTLALFLQHLANALALGSLYALIAIGYTMVYGILRLINFAHGDVFMLGAYLAFYGVAFFLLPWWATFLIAIVFTAMLGIALERVAYRPLRDSPRISVMISAIGASFLIENVAVVLFGGRPKGVTVPDVMDVKLALGGVSVMSVIGRHPGLHLRHPGRAPVGRAPHQDRHGHAGRRDRPRRRAPAGHRREPDHLLHLRRGLAAGRLRRDPLVLQVPAARTRSWGSCRA